MDSQNSAGQSRAHRPHPKNSAKSRDALRAGTRMPGMRRSLSSLTLLLAAMAVCFFVAVENAPAQGTTGSVAPQGEIVLNKLSPPAYPPLARQARIGGDVKIQLEIRLDGSVASAKVISGHPML